MRYSTRESGNVETVIVYVAVIVITPAVTETLVGTRGASPLPSPSPRAQAAVKLTANGI